MEAHVFAVWDFMALLKSLQGALTCVSFPWVPTPHPASRRFINEIVLGEESDEYQGQALSHFELYVKAMEEVGADTVPIHRVVDAIRNGGDWKLALNAAPRAAQDFVAQTFRFIESRSVAAQAAAFTFGREDVIPGMFRSIVRDLNGEVKTETFLWYLERHIQVDGDEHGPFSLKMIEDICGDDPDLWDQATSAASAALRARLGLWDDVLTSIRRVSETPPRKYF